MLHVSVTCRHVHRKFSRPHFRRKLFLAFRHSRKKRKRTFQSCRRTILVPCCELEMKAVPGLKSAVKQSVHFVDAGRNDGRASNHNNNHVYNAAVPWIWLRFVPTFVEGSGSVPPSPFSFRLTLRFRRMWSGFILAYVSGKCPAFSEECLTDERDFAKTNAKVPGIRTKT